MSLREEFKRFSGKHVSVTELTERVKAQIGEVDMTSPAFKRAIAENALKLSPEERRDIQQVQFFIADKVARDIERSALRGESYDEALYYLQAELNGLATRRGVYADAFHLVAMMSLTPDKRIVEAYAAAADACEDYAFDHTIGCERLLERVQEQLGAKFRRR